MEFKTLFVTCGATVPFPQLIETVLSPTLSQNLLKFGFKRIIVQFGRGYRESFKRFIDIKNAPIPLESDLKFDGKPVYGFYDSLEVIGFDYSTGIQEVIQEKADLVISHAGTGSILDSLRLGKPLIVCVNDTLMDNHQQEIADQFASSNYLWACLPRIDEMVECLRKSQSEKTVPFPSAHNKSFEKTLLGMAYGNLTNNIFEP